MRRAMDAFAEHYLATYAAIFLPAWTPRGRRRGPAPRAGAPPPGRARRPHRAPPRAVRRPGRPPRRPGHRRRRCRRPRPPRPGSMRGAAPDAGRLDRWLRCEEPPATSLDTTLADRRGFEARRLAALAPQPPSTGDLGLTHDPHRHPRAHRRPAQRRDPDLGQRRAEASRRGGGLGLRLGVRAGRRRLGGHPRLRRTPGLPRAPPRPALGGRQGDHARHRDEPRRADRGDLRHDPRQRHDRRRAHPADGDARREVHALPGPADDHRPRHRGDHRRAQGADALDGDRRHHALHHPRTPRDPRHPRPQAQRALQAQRHRRPASRPTPPAPTRR